MSAELRGVRPRSIARLTGLHRAPDRMAPRARMASVRSSRRWCTGKSCCTRLDMNARIRSSSVRSASSMRSLCHSAQGTTRRFEFSLAFRRFGIRASRSTRSPTAVTRWMTTPPRVRRRGLSRASVALRVIGRRTSMAQWHRAVGTLNTRIRTTQTRTTVRWLRWRSRASHAVARRPLNNQCRPALRRLLPPSAECVGFSRCRMTMAVGRHSTVRAIVVSSSTFRSPTTTRCKIRRALTSPGVCLSAFRGTASRRSIHPFVRHSRSFARGRSRMGPSLVAGVSTTSTERGKR